MSSSPPHRRWNPLLGEWVLVSAHRTKRPWQGRTEEVASPQPPYDPECYLCPGNVRASGERNPYYPATLVFTNDFPALLPEPAGVDVDGDPVFGRREPVRGTSRVLCFSPRHDLTLATMSPTELLTVIDLWAGQIESLEETYHWVQVFENRGEAMGASNPHPHGQVWATDTLPSIPARELASQRDFFDRHGRPMLTSYAEREAGGDRHVCSAGSWMAVVPFWAVWPFETIVLSTEPVQRLYELTPESRRDLAEVLRVVLRAYDRLFDTPFPYSMGWHGAPAGAVHPEWALHGHFYPPLLRSATVRKFLVGYEMLAESQRDLTAEDAAARLREAGA